jgi:hypothetical protein
VPPLTDQGSRPARCSDGFGGANDLHKNVLFNTCRESSDHGAFNSWDRLPYVTTVGDGSTPSTVPAYTLAHANLIVANYGADGGCLDNDDGSSYYRIYGNACFFGGHTSPRLIRCTPYRCMGCTLLTDGVLHCVCARHKSDFDGHSKLSYGNLHIHPSVYGIKCVGELQAAPKKGYAEGYFNNTCVLPSAGAMYARLAGCPGDLRNDSASVAALEEGYTLGNNTVYVPGGSAVYSCGSLSVNSSEVQRRGYDRGTVFKDGAPSNDTLAKWVRALWSAES